MNPVSTHKMQNTLLLNAGYEPLRIVSWQRAFVLVFQGKVEIVREYNIKIRTVARAYKVPAVIRLNRWIQIKRKSPMIRFSRNNVYIRDEYKCQYCHKTFLERELTLDHVYPAVRGGQKTWENIVTACRRCNQKKGNRTPEEAGLKILRYPQVPGWLPGNHSTVRKPDPPDIWEPFLTA